MERILILRLCYSLLAILFVWLIVIVTLTVLYFKRNNAINKKKEKLSGHQISIATMYITKVINALEIDSNVSQTNDSNFDNWAITHDIDCLKATIKYLE